MVILAAPGRSFESNYSSLTLAGETYHPYAIPSRIIAKIWICAAPSTAPAIKLVQRKKTGSNNWSRYFLLLAVLGGTAIFVCAAENSTPLYKSRRTPRLLPSGLEGCLIFIPMFFFFESKQILL